MNQEKNLKAAKKNKNKKQKHFTFKRVIILLTFDFSTQTIEDRR